MVLFGALHAALLLVDPLTLVTPLLTGVVGFFAGYALHKVRVRAEDAREVRDRVGGPLLAEVSKAVESLSHDLLNLPDALQVIRELVRQGMLNPARLRGLKMDVIALQSAYDSAQASLHSAEVEINREIQAMLVNRVNLKIVPQAGGTLGPFPYEEFNVSHRDRLTNIVYKDWKTLVEHFKSTSNRPAQWNILSVVDWDYFWNSNRSKFEGLVDKHLGNIGKYRENLEKVKGALEKWTANIHRPYEGVLADP